MKKREPEAFFNVILNSIADGVFTTDNDGKITFMNKAAEEITGFLSKEAIGPGQEYAGLNQWNNCCK